MEKKASPIFIRSGDSYTDEERLADDPLRDFHVWWLRLTPANARIFADGLNAAGDERACQMLLEENPIILAQVLRGGHGRWVIPQKRLGAEHVTDFVLGQRDSVGFEWLAVELESPRAPMFTKAGDPSRHLTHAIRQIQDWRAWLQRNQNYAARPLAESGLGLTDITANIPGIILLGRRAELDPRVNDRRRQMISDLGIEIHTYDFLLDIVGAKAEWCETSRRERAAKLQRPRN